MAWQSLPTYASGNVPTAAELNKYSENLNFLHAPIVTSYEETNDASNYTTTSAPGTFVAISGTNYQIAVTTSGGYVLVLFCAVISYVTLDLFVDTVAQGHATTGSAIHATPDGNLRTSVNLLFPFYNLSAASHTFEMKWCKGATGAGTGTIYTAFRPRMYVVQLRGS